MAFFARPNLDDIQFKQLTGSTLTLEGQTKIATTSGLTLTDGYGGYVPIVATGGTNNYVLTYDLIENVIKLKEPTASGGTGTYDGLSPTTCTVGGLATNSPIFGCSVNDILQSILVPTLNPILTPNSSSLSLSPTTTIFEIGSSACFTGTINYNCGSVSPVYCGGTPRRTGLPTSYLFTNVDGTQYSGTSNSCAMPAASICSPTQTVYGVTYYSGGTAPTKSDGTFMTGVTCAAGSCAATKPIIGLYPYFYGSTSVAPILTSDACAQCLITGGTKCIGYSTNDVLVSNYNVTGKYVWVAIPSISTSKTKWQGSNSPSNCGTIPGDLFLGECLRNITSTLSRWTSIPYKIYVSSYPTSINYGMTYKNS